MIEFSLAAYRCIGALSERVLGDLAFYHMGMLNL